MSLIPEQKNQLIVKPFIYGSVAINLGKKYKEQATHKWCVYVRGVNNENISNFIKSVQFTLHETFQNKVRIVNKWPFELYESGWGEFDVKVKIDLIDESIKPIELIHPLKFYSNQSQNSKKPVVCETYDEIIFVNPKPEILEQLLKDDNSNKNLNNSFQEPLISKHLMEIEESKNGEQQGENNNNATNSIMEVEDEDKSQVNSSQMVQSINNNNKQSNLNQEKLQILIPNISQYFQKFDDTPEVKVLEDINEFVIQEIEKLKQNLNEKEQEINRLNKEIRNFK